MSNLNLRTNSCIELSEIRKLDNLLSQCETSSCEFTIFDENYDDDKFCSSLDSLDKNYLIHQCNNCSDFNEIKISVKMLNVIKTVPEDTCCSTKMLNKTNDKNCVCDNFNLKTRSCSHLGHSKNNKKLTINNEQKCSSFDCNTSKNNFKKQKAFDHDNKITRCICTGCGKLQKTVTIEENVDFEIGKDQEPIMSSKSSQISFGVRSDHSIEYPLNMKNLTDKCSMHGRSRSKFSPQILAKRISGRSTEDEKGVKESLLGHARLDSFHVDKLLPETVETVCNFTKKKNNYNEIVFKLTRK